MGTHYGTRPFGNLTSRAFFSRANAAFTLDNKFDLDENILRVRRSSDNEEDDFSTRELQDGTLEAWVGGGNNGLITVWYDQSGNENHAVQTDPARQPVIVTNGTIFASVSVANANVYLDIPAFTTEGTLVTVTASGTYRLGVEVTDSAHRIYTYHIWGIEALLYYGRTLSDTDYERTLNVLTEFGYSVERNFGADWTNAFRGRTDLRDVSKLDFTGVTNLSDGFRSSGANQWLSDNEDMFATGGDVTSFRDTFRGNSITSVPENLFANNPNVTDFRVTFYRNSLTSVPENLFANCPNVTSFSFTFRENSIESVPENLFANNPNVTNFSLTFFDNSITSVPENLFANNPNVTNFGNAFSRNSITSVPAGLFDNQTQALNYENIFTNCALTQSSVDNVLVSVNNSVQANDITNGRIDITGGTNSPPSGTGNAAITALIEKGWTVNVNS